MGFQWVENNPTNIHVFRTNIRIFHLMVLRWRLFADVDTDVCGC